MIKIEIQIYPFGDSSRRRKIETVYIANRGRVPYDLIGGILPDEAQEVCRYEVWRGANPNQKKRFGEGGIVVHNRRDGALKLVSMALDALYEIDRGQDEQSRVRGHDPSVGRQ